MNAEMFDKAEKTWTHKLFGVERTALSADGGNVFLRSASSAACDAEHPHKHYCRRVVDNDTLEIKAHEMSQSNFVECVCPCEFRQFSKCRVKDAPIAYLLALSNKGRTYALAFVAEFFLHTREMLMRASYVKRLEFAV
jgi:hypothetical protein